MKVNNSVQLLRYTADPEATVAAAARLCYSSDDLSDIVSTAMNKDNGKFIDRLISLGHYSPFEHASFTFAIEGVSRAFLAQVTRHRIASFSVKSQRYVSSESFNYIIPPEIEKLGEEAKNKFCSQMATMNDWYAEWQAQLGGAGEKANEDARFVLPNACETKMVLTMNARELMHFFELRCCNRAQWEIRDVAWQMLKLVIEVAPNLFRKCGPTCVAKGCSEGKMSCGKVDEVRLRRSELDRKI